MQESVRAKMTAVYKIQQTSIWGRGQRAMGLRPTAPLWETASPSFQNNIYMYFDLKVRGPCNRAPPRDSPLKTCWCHHCLSWPVVCLVHVWVWLIVTSVFWVLIILFYTYVLFLILVIGVNQQREWVDELTSLYLKKKQKVIIESIPRHWCRRLFSVASVEDEVTVISDVLS